MSFLWVPVEIVVEILESLDDWKDVLHCMEVCTFLHAIISNTVRLQCKIEYGAALVAYNNGSLDHPMCPADSLDALRRLERGWAFLEWRKRVKYRMRDDSSIYELQQGFFVRGIRFADTMQRPNTLWLQPLPRGDDVQRSPTMLSLGFDICDFNIDPEQGLIVCVCPTQIHGMPTIWAYGVTVRLNQLTDGAPHPSARLPLLDVACQATERSGFFIQIHGDFIGVLMKSGVGELDRFWLYDWKQGVLQATVSSRYLDNFIFLSSTYFLLVRREQTSNLEIYSFRPRRVLSKVIPPPKPPRLLASYGLPDLARSATVSGCIGVRCEPTPVYIPPQFDVEGTPEADNKSDPDPPSRHSVGDASKATTSSFSSPKAAPASRGALFPMNGPVARPTEDAFRLAVLTMGLVMGLSRRSYTMFVAITDLFRRAKEHERAHEQQQRPGSAGTPFPFNPLVVPWKGWGPQSTRMMEGSNSGAWVCYVYMHRFVYHTIEPLPLSTGPPNEGRDQEPTSFIHVLDFNPNVMHPNSPPYRHISYPPPEEQHHRRQRQDRRAFAIPLKDSNALQAEETSEPSFQSIVIDRPTSIPADMFADELVTSLPLRKTTSTVPFAGVLSPMIDAERIILIDTEARCPTMEVFVI